ncbi:MAG TPA: hypothetical protein PKC39_13425 [Ferruginibacter sp.]|nr:hypothetical protein [Ferruginibacter sp.]HMP21955.1 hypothetical protein [Ferruginibacter sp.]
MNAQKKILLVQLYSNGDCLYATAIARQIKHDFPGCSLTWMIASFCRNIILHNPFLDAVEPIDSVAKNDAAALRQLKRKVFARKAAGEFQEVFFIHNGDTNQAYYDGCIRSSILRAYGKPVTVPLTPVLQLSDAEKQKAAAFATQHQLIRFRHVILFEYAPQSGQSAITALQALEIAGEIAKQKNAAIILSSANAISSNITGIIDGSTLTLRETAALTHYCTFLLGSSSGITWISTADAAKQLPMVQLLNPNAVWINPISRDFERFGFSTSGLIELTDYPKEKIIDCVCTALDNFSAAKAAYNQIIPLHFKSTKNIVYNLLCYLELGAIIKHIQVNREVYGNHPGLYKQVIAGFLIFPFRLVKNIITKKRK